jgi:hypothetical protein
MLRRLLHITSRIGMPGTLLSLGDAGGRILYLSAEMSPVSVVVGLEHDDVLALHEACSSWLREQDDREHPEPFTRPAPLVAGALVRSITDARSTSGTTAIAQTVQGFAPPTTVQTCTDVS